jgi:hypothetical protein
VVESETEKERVIEREETERENEEDDVIDRLADIEGVADTVKVPVVEHDSEMDGVKLFDFVREILDVNETVADDIDGDIVMDGVFVCVMD